MSSVGTSVDLLRGVMTIVDARIPVAVVVAVGLSILGGNRQIAAKEEICIMLKWRVLAY